MHVRSANEIEYHDLWCAACYLHPALCNFNFCTQSVSSQSRQRGESLVRQMVSEHWADHKRSTTDTGSSDIDVTQNIRDVRGTSRSKSCSIASKMSFITTPNASNDEVSRYNPTAFTSSEINILKTDPGIVDFWLSKMVDFHVLHKIALYLVRVPPSSSRSEQDLSALKFSVTLGSSKFKDDIINAKSVVLSASRM